MSEKPVSTERDDIKWPEPLAALFGRVRYQSHIILMLVALVGVEAIMLFVLGSRAAAHVYEVRPDGSAEFIGDREANVSPRPAEARYVAKRFVELLQGWNSSTALEDATAAINLCGQAFGAQLGREFAASQFVANLRARNVRTEIDWGDITVMDASRNGYRVQVRGTARVYPIAKFETEPLDVRAFALIVVLGVAPRDPETRLNGLEVLRIESVDSNAKKETPRDAK